MVSGPTVPSSISPDGSAQEAELIKKSEITTRISFFMTFNSPSIYDLNIFFYCIMETFFWRVWESDRKIIFGGTLVGESVDFGVYFYWYSGDRKKG